MPDLFFFSCAVAATGATAFMPDEKISWAACVGTISGNWRSTYADGGWWRPDNIVVWTQTCDADTSRIEYSGQYINNIHGSAMMMEVDF